jgi:hypothetical protein
LLAIYKGGGTNTEDGSGETVIDIAGYITPHVSLFSSTCITDKKTRYV